MKHTGTDDVIELATQIAGVLDWYLSHVEVRQVVLLFQPLGVIETRRADVDRNHARRRMTKRMLRGLPGSASRDQYIKIVAVFSARPQQMKLRTPNIFVLVEFQRPIEIFERRRKWMVSVKLTDRI